MVQQYQPVASSVSNSRMSCCAQSYGEALNAVSCTPCPGLHRLACVMCTRNVPWHSRVQHRTC
eukprot:14557233-Alexandrium_andersonii.AAC.1